MTHRLQEVGVEQDLKVTLPIEPAQLVALKAGMRVRLYGVIYTARDAAHLRMIQALEAGEALPFDIRQQAIYYVGPTPAQAGRPIGACGPTTSYRMDPLTPALLEEGLKVMIGKGERSPEVIEAMKAHQAVYLAATGGAGALLSTRVKSCELVAYGDLGAEAIYKLEVEDFPAVVVIDCSGLSAYDLERAKYRITKAD